MHKRLVPRRQTHIQQRQIVAYPASAGGIAGMRSGNTGAASGPSIPAARQPTNGTAVSGAAEAADTPAAISTPPQSTTMVLDRPVGIAISAAGKGGYLFLRASLLCITALCFCSTHFRRRAGTNNPRCGRRLGKVWLRTSVSACFCAAMGFRAGLYVVSVTAGPLISRQVRLCRGSVIPNRAFSHGLQDFRTKNRALERWHFSGAKFWCGAGGRTFCVGLIMPEAAYQLP